MDNRPIGVFDSGVGGLNVLSELIKEFPMESFIYLADTKNCPYGIKTKEQLVVIVEENIRFFESLNVKAIVIACNTATANSYNIKSSVPIIRIIEPTAKKALEVGKKILVLATNYTISSGAYNIFLKDKMIGLPCSEFVDIVEKGKEYIDSSQNIVNQKLSSYYNEIDTIILGCTHFTLLLPQIQKCLENKIIVDSSKCINDELQNILQKNNMLANQSKRTITYYMTKKIKDFNVSWFNENITTWNLAKIKEKI